NAPDGEMTPEKDLRMVMKFAGSDVLASGVNPAAQEVVINAGQLHTCGWIGRSLIDLLNRGIEIEEQSALGIVAHHALDPEERSDARAARYGFDVVETRRGVNHHVARGQFHAVESVGVFDDEFAAVVFAGSGEK